MVLNVETLSILLNLFYTLPRFHVQVQSRLERVGTGVLRLATGKKVVKDLPAMKQTSVDVDSYRKWLCTHTSIVRDLVDYHMAIYELVGGDSPSIYIPICIYI